MKILLMSDLHNKLLPPREEYLGADCLIVCGDLTEYGTEKEVKKITEMLAYYALDLQIFKIIVTPGNHDNWLEDKKNIEDYLTFLSNLKVETGVEISLEIDKLLVINNKKIYVSPYYRRIGTDNIFAFNYTDKQAEELFKQISNLGFLDLLVTHGPPLNILDTDKDTQEPMSFGCPVFADYLDKLNCNIYAFGHIHEHGGEVVIKDNKTYYNVACTARLVEI